MVRVFPGCFCLSVDGASWEVTDLALLLWETGSKRKAWQRVDRRMEHRIDRRMELLQTLVKNVLWKAGSDEPWLCNTEKRIKRCKKQGYKEMILQACPGLYILACCMGKKALIASDVLDACHYKTWLCIHGVRCETGCWLLLAQLCAAGALMACAGELMGCCFLHMLGQFSFPAPYIPFVAPAIEFTWPRD